MVPTLEYIMSGTSYTRMVTADDFDDTELLVMLDKIYGRIPQLTDHKFGILYNAFTEPRASKTIVKLKSLHSIHADSGGLQIITRGMSATDLIKDKIYRNQAEYADLGMCFDEIPIDVVGDSSARNDIFNRIFDVTLLESKARETGRNITRQIEIFLEEKSKCKPILIAQGNCYDTYMKWVDYILDEIPSDMHQYIGGVAMGGAALGTGMLEDIERAFIYSQLPIEKTHLHILGVGSVRRMLPYLAFMKNGLYTNESISYDSTTHSSGIELGSYFHGSRLKSYKRSFGSLHDTMYNESNLVYNVGIDIKELFKILNISRMGYEGNGGDGVIWRAARVAVISSSIINFCRHVDKIVKDDNMYFNACNTKGTEPVKGLLEVHNLRSFNKWKTHAGRFIKSSRVNTMITNNLEGFFE